MSWRPADKNSHLIDSLSFQIQACSRNINFLNLGFRPLFDAGRRSDTEQRYWISVFKSSRDRTNVLQTFAFCGPRS